LSFEPVEESKDHVPDDGIAIDDAVDKTPVSDAGSVDGAIDASEENKNFVQLDDVDLENVRVVRTFTVITDITGEKTYDSGKNTEMFANGFDTLEEYKSMKKKKETDAIVEILNEKIFNDNFYKKILDVAMKFYDNGTEVLEIVSTVEETVENDEKKEFVELDMSTFEEKNDKTNKKEFIEIDELELTPDLFKDALISGLKESFVKIAKESGRID
jgi:hypothetical protein